MSITVFGISNCDQVRKARNWLSEQGFEFVFYDFRKQGLSEAQISQWIDALGWEQVINKRSTAWRALNDEDKANMDAQKAAICAAQTPTLIKRPLLAVNHTFIPGFNESTWREALA